MAIILAWVWMWTSAYQLRAPLLRLGLGPRNVNYLLISWRDLASAAAAVGLLLCSEIWAGRANLVSVLRQIGLPGLASPSQQVVLAVLLFSSCYAINLGFGLVRQLSPARPRAGSANLAPATATETLFFLLILSPASGVGEEIVFRGALQWLFTALTADPISAVLSQAVLFGIVHLYQGGFGVLRNIAIGAVLGIGTMSSGSLVPAIVAHTLINAVVAAGSAIGARTSSRD